MLGNADVAHMGVSNTCDAAIALLCYAMQFPPNSAGVASGVNVVVEWEAFLFFFN